MRKKKLLSGYRVVFITTPTKKCAKVLTTILLKKRIAACVNIVSSIESHFWWEGKIDIACECLLIAKTHRRKMKEFMATVKQVHSYQVPEVIALPIVAGNKDYLLWLTESLSL